MRLTNIAAKWICVGIATGSLAIMAGAGKCCQYFYSLTDSPDAFGDPATCQAGKTVCQCEKEAVSVPANEQGWTNNGYRLAECYCYLSSDPLDYLHTDCGSDPGVGWTPLWPPLNPNSSPPICCWVNTFHKPLVRVTQGFQIDDCGTPTCKVH